MALVHTILGFTGVMQMLLSIAGLWLPMHCVSFFTAMGVVRVFRMQTFVRTVVVEERSSDVHVAMSALAPKYWNKRLTGEHSIQEVAHRFCAPGIQTVFPGICAGLDNANYLGLVIALAYSVSLTFEAIALFQFYDYVTRKPSRSRRKGAFWLILVGAMICLLALAIYGMGVLMYLDNMQPVGMFAWTFAPSGGTGISAGFILLCAAAVLQMITAFGINSSRHDDEEFEEEKRDIMALQRHIELQQGLPTSVTQPAGPGLPAEAALRQQGPGAPYAHQPAAAPLWQQGPVPQVAWQHPVPGLEVPWQAAAWQSSDCSHR